MNWNNYFQNQLLFDLFNTCFTLIICSQIKVTFSFCIKPNTRGKKYCFIKEHTAEKDLLISVALTLTFQLFKT